jgi:hypothetical protein
MGIQPDHFEVTPRDQLAHLTRNLSIAKQNAPSIHCVR